MGKPYSYHTFILPFEIQGKVKDVPIDRINDFVNTKYWKKIEKEDANLLFNSVFQEDENKDKKTLSAIEYNQRQYFHDNVLKAIHNDKNCDIVTEYVYDCFNSSKVIELEIRGDVNASDDNSGKSQSDVKLYKYVLKVSNVRLKVYNTGIGVLILDIYNDSYRDFKSVKEINEYGRHISLPYIAIDKGDILCAESVTWKFHNSNKNDCCFRELNNSFGEQNYNDDSYKIDFFNSMIIDSSYNGSYIIKPSLDDRMFMCCLIRDKFLSKIFSMDYDIEDQNNFQFDEELSKSLYEYIYIDRDGKCTAPTSSFRKRILNESIYNRWSAFGTVYGSSHTSLVGITGEFEGVESMIIRPFLTQYVEIAILALVQRASILRFQRQSGGDLSNKQIQELQKKYVDYRNQLHFFEVSSQEQGIELYELIRKQLYIEKEIESLEKNLEILYEKSNVDMSNKIGTVGIWIALISLLGTFFDILSYFRSHGFDNCFLKKFCSLFPENAIIIIIVIVFIYKATIYFKNRKIKSIQILK